MDSFEARAQRRRATWTGIVAHAPAEAAAFERAAAEAVPPAQRAEAIWELVLRMPWGTDATEYRLDRSVGRVQRRRG